MSVKSTALLLSTSTWLALAIPSSYSAQLGAFPGQPGDYFGRSVSQYGNTGLVGAYLEDDYRNSPRTQDQGAAYLFRNLDTATGTVTQNVKLTTANARKNRRLGWSVSLSGSIGLVGGDSGMAYVYRNLDTSSGTVTENVALTASDVILGSVFTSFITSVSLSSNIGLVGVFDQESAYVYRNLDTAAGTITQNVKLIASDVTGDGGSYFGLSVSQSGSIGLIGARGATGNGSGTGAAYIYRNLDVATGTTIQDVKLIASEGSPGDRFGCSVSLSENAGLVGADGTDIGNIGDTATGSVYLYRNLDTASGAVTQNAKLVATDAHISSYFGSSVSLSGSTGLVAAYDGNDLRGSVYVYRNLDTASGTVTENVKITRSAGGYDNGFGSSVSLNDDQFIIGAVYGSSVLESAGGAYTGTVSSVTTLDEGNAIRTINRISFVSQDHWVIGQTGDANQVTLSSGDSANVTAPGKSIFIGQNPGSDANILNIKGTLVATSVYIGSTAGNIGNILRCDSGATITAGTIYLSRGNELQIQGDLSNATAALNYLSGVTLTVDNSTGWVPITVDNFANLANVTFNTTTNYTTITAKIFTPLESWRLRFFTSILNAGDGDNLADPNSNGLVNLLEYALDLDPLATGTASTIATSTETGTGKLQITFKRARSTNELTYTIQASSDLIVWTDLVTNPGTVGQDVTVTDTPPNGATRRFLRLKVNIP